MNASSLGTEQQHALRTGGVEPAAAHKLHRIISSPLKYNNVEYLLNF